MYHLLVVHCVRQPADTERQHKMTPREKVPLSFPRSASSTPYDVFRPPPLSHTQPSLFNLYLGRTLLIIASPKVALHLLHLLQYGESGPMDYNAVGPEKTLLQSTEPRVCLPSPLRSPCSRYRRVGGSRFLLRLLRSPASSPAIPGAKIKLEHAHPLNICIGKGPLRHIFALTTNSLAYPHRYARIEG